MKRPLVASIAILAAWTASGANLRSQRQFVASVRPDEHSSHLRSDFCFDRVRRVYRLLVRPKSVGAGLALGAFVGLGLGI
jgi:hypothetical protein